MTGFVETIGRMILSRAGINMLCVKESRLSWGEGGGMDLRQNKHAVCVKESRLKGSWT